MIYTLNDVVSRVKIDLGRSDSTHDMKFKKWAIDGWKQLNVFNVAPFFKTVKLQVENRRVNLPEDFQEEVKVGFCKGGKLVSLSVNEKICLLPEGVCCEEATEDMLNTDLGFLDERGRYYQLEFMPYESSQVFTGYYGHGMSLYRGGYKIDLNNRQVVFDFDIEEVVIEYRGGEDNTYVPDYCIQALVEYVHLQRCKYSFNQAERNMLPIHKNEWIRQVRIVNSKVNGLTANQILDIFRNSFRHTLKV